jgi:hypothetical protein
MEGESVMRYFQGLIWMIRKFGVRRTFIYENERAYREFMLKRKFDPKVDGEPLLRACGYGDDEVAKFKEAGLA